MAKCISKGIWLPFRRGWKNDMNALLSGTKSETFLKVFLKKKIFIECSVDLHVSIFFFLSAKPGLKLSSRKRLKYDFFFFLLNWIMTTSKASRWRLSSRLIF